MSKKSWTELVEIYNDTLQYSKEIIKSKPPESQKYKIIDDENYDKHTKKFNKTNIIVENCDVIQSIMNLHDLLQSNQTNKILVLNLASYRCFGGGVRTGSMAQEEELFRKTDYGNHSGSRKLYPLAMDEFVYTPCVYVVKDSNYNHLHSKDIIPFDALAIAGIRNPSLENNRLCPDDYELTKRKIETIFKFALDNGNTNLVLGALGCGAYHNPPEDIIEIYNYCLKKYNGYFENIVFSILSINNDNFRLFDEKLIRN